MYTLRLVTESGATAIGGTIRTLAEALKQVEIFSSIIPGAKKLEGFEGVQWNTEGGTMRILGIVDELGLPISTKEKED